MNSKIILNATISTILLVILGIVSIVKMQELSGLTQKLYMHPLAVTNATKRIDSNLIFMNNYMQGLLYSHDKDDIQNAINRVNESEKVIFQKFTIVFDRYLGDKKDIQKSYDAFISWKPIRDEIIGLINQQEYAKAKKIYKEKSITHVSNLSSQVAKMIAYADHKAIVFRENAVQSEKSAITVIIIVLVGVVFGNIIMVYLLLKDMNKNEKQIKEHFHLIDQNIMSAKTDKEYKIIEMSNALSRHLGMGKEELLAKKECSLLNDCPEDTRKQIKLIVESGEEFKGEIVKLDADNEEKWFAAHISPVFDSDYNIVEYTNILHDISLQKKIETMSNTDALTNLYNRRYFDEVFPKTTKIAQREGHCIAFCMIDIDFFKQYNDTYGHQAGDTTLKKVARVLKSTMQRPDDYSFRLGGEEFGLLYKVDDEKSALRIARQVKENVENLHIEHSSSTASIYVTISIGVYIVAKDEHINMDEVYAKCDEALYTAKNAGRNQVKLA